MTQAEGSESAWAKAIAEIEATAARIVKDFMVAKVEMYSRREGEEDPGEYCVSIYTDRPLALRLATRHHIPYTQLEGILVKVSTSLYALSGSSVSGKH